MAAPEITINLSAADGSSLEDALAGFDLGELTFADMPDDGYESAFTDTVASFAGTTAAAMKNVIAKLRDFADTSEARQISVTINGVRRPLGELTDAEVESLFPA
ncbi:MAG: hypothetical protein R8F63_17895 [Acidimicrobiales bacterium]|nr:hypothetical protein [Acidimicrobiales bacterium]